jgi:hypothetical protein
MQETESLIVLQDELMSMWPQQDEDEQRDHEAPKRWMVEYIVEFNGERNHHLTILRADDAAGAHKELLRELQRTYMTSERVEVMVVKMEPISPETNTLLFEGIYAP